MGRYEPGNQYEISWQSSWLVLVSETKHGDRRKDRQTGTTSPLHAVELWVLKGRVSVQRQSHG